MFGPFGRRSTRKPPPPNRDGALPVIVRRSEAAPTQSEGGDYYLVDAVTRYTQRLTDSWSEIPESAVQVYCMVDYLGQVENGGHSQYIANRLDALPTRANLAAQGMETIGAREHLSILRDMQRWVADNPFPAARQTGFQGGRAPELDALDARFRNIQASDPLDARMANWIADWPELCIVEDSEYAEALKRLAESNPKREARRIFQSISRLSVGMMSGTGLDQGQAGYAAAAVDLLLRKAGLTPEASYAAPDSNSRSAAPERHWIVLNDLRPFYAVTGDKGGVLVPADDANAATTVTRAEVESHQKAAQTGAV